MIPDEAVEAAAEAIQGADGMRYDEFFTDFGAPELARAALEAAAPFIAAAVLDEAADRAVEQELQHITPAMLKRRAKSYRREAVK